MNEITTQVEGLIPSIRQAEREQLRLRNEIAIAEEEYKSSPAYKAYLNASRQLTLAEQSELELRSKAKDIMIMNWIHDFTTLDGITVQLNKTPGTLVIEEGAKIPEEYYRVKKEIDKAAIKKDFNLWIPFDEKIYIQLDYKLIVKEK